MNIAHCEPQNIANMLSAYVDDVHIDNVSPVNLEDYEATHYPLPSRILHQRLHDLQDWKGKTVEVNIHLRVEFECNIETWFYSNLASILDFYHLTFYKSYFLLLSLLSAIKCHVILMILSIVLFWKRKVRFQPLINEYERIQLKIVGVLTFV